MSQALELRDLDSSGPTSFEVRPPLNSEVQRISKDILQGLQYSFLAATAAQDVPLPEGSVEEAFRNAVATRSPEVRASYRDKARNLVEAPNCTRRALFGRYAELSIDEFRRFGFARASESLPPLSLSFDRLRAAFKAEQNAGGRQSCNFESIQPGRIEANSALRFRDGLVTTLELYITAIRHRNETEYKRRDDVLANGAVLVSGLALDAASHVKKVPQMQVEPYGHLAPGQAGKLFCSFKAKTAGHWPATFSGILFIAERNSGQFEQYVTDAWERAGPRIKELVEKVVEREFSDRVAEVTAGIIREIVGWLVGELFIFITRGFEDDVLIPAATSVDLCSPALVDYKSTGGWKDLASPVGTLTFLTHWGTYTIECFWKVGGREC